MARAKRCEGPNKVHQSLDVGQPMRSASRKARIGCVFALDISYSQTRKSCLRCGPRPNPRSRLSADLDRPVMGLPVASAIIRVVVGVLLARTDDGTRGSVGA